MNEPPSAEDAERTPEGGELQARNPFDPGRTVDRNRTGESDAIVLLDEYTQIRGKLPPHTARQDTSPVRRLARLRQWIHKKPPGDDVLTALCLSGGGIRSATFGLGVLQGLARIGRLDRFDYLSTVSGGGYIGCWLEAWLHRAARSEVSGNAKAVAAGPASSADSCTAAQVRGDRKASAVGQIAVRVLRFVRKVCGDRKTSAVGSPSPLHSRAASEVFDELKASAVGRLSESTAERDRPTTPKSEPEAVRRLRAYSNYLSPAVGLGGDLMALVAIFVRNLFLHWLVLLPALFALLMLPRVYLALMDSMTAALSLGDAAPWVALFGAGFLFLVALVADSDHKPAFRLGLFGWIVVALAFLGLTFLGVVSPTVAGSRLALFAIAAFAVALSIAYMAADLPETPPDAPESAADVPGTAADLPATLPHREPTLQDGPKSRFHLLSHLPLVLASLLFSLLAPSLTSDAGLQALQPAAAAQVPWLTARPWTVVALAYAVGFGFLHVAAACIGMAWRGRRGLEKRSVPRPVIESLITFAIGAVGGLALLGTMAVLSNGWTPAPAPPAAPLAASALARREFYAIVAMPAMMAVFWLTVTLYAGLTRRMKSEEDREWWARAAGFWLLSAIGWCALFTAVLLLPRLLLAVPDALGLEAGSEALTGGAALLGVLSSAWGYWSRNGQKIAGQVQGVLARLNARLLDVLSAAFIVLLAAVLGLGLSRALEWIGDDRVEVAATAPAAPPASAPAAVGATPLARQVDALVEAERAAAERAARCARASATAASAPVAAQTTATDCPRPGLSDAQRAAATFRAVLHTAGIGTAAGLLAGFAGMAWLMAFWIGTNTFSLHSMYGNRLIRAYLGASNPPSQRQPHHFTGFDPTDNVELAALAGCRPFLVINAALNLVQSSGERLEWQQRKAASFIFTPRSCGSSVLGYAPTTHYARKPLAREGLTLGRAMAISGAAASPNMGYHSSRVVAFVMSFFNVRLGWWLPNTRVPAGGDADKAHESWARDEPPGAKTLLAETLARTTEASEFVYLSDGGHFENLGLYEMVRRRCRRIVVVDATRDPLYCHEDLVSSVRKIRIDFGISIDFPRGLPTAASCGRHGKPWALGRIHYADADKGAPLAGALLYLKPALWSGLPPDVLHYAETSKKRGTAFPHESTRDQFFDEAQFESYRLLGLLTVLKAFGEPGRWPEGDGPDHREPAASPPAKAEPRAAAPWLRRALWAAASAARRRLAP